MNIETIQYLHDLHFITREQHERLSRVYSKEVFSLHYELRAAMFVGALLLIAGLGLFAFRNLDTIGHQIIIFTIFAMTSACFVYAGFKAPAYSNDRVAASTIAFDTILVLGCVLFLLLVCYTQFVHLLFGDEWQLAGLIPALVYIPLAYRFDHRGVLVFGIVLLAAAIGLAVAPITLINRGFVPTNDLVSVGFAFGALSIVSGFATNSGNIKRHFASPYIHSGVHFLFLACLAGIVFDQQLLLFLLLLTTLSGCGVFYARRAQSFSVLLVTSLYSYVGVSYVASRIIADTAVQSVYGIVSFIAVLTGLFMFKKSFSANA
jgi:hypothetical protein